MARPSSGHRSLGKEREEDQGDAELPSSHGAGNGTGGMNAGKAVQRRVRRFARCTWECCAGSGMRAGGVGLVGTESWGGGLRRGGGGRWVFSFGIECECGQISLYLLSVDMLEHILAGQHGMWPLNLNPNNVNCKY
ncbi:hypothetical protein E2562_028776 [Oryza meyeriana var. granulata]|uniref:Uncharacterized protein n=1 Tax=Oryza meyeriana var. granulata TaxID=110450 RepID=A0A6G1FD56_9ORYZ|nr:hypothetical protein E2562_028776 [Oryza meyeriana var. granulata]